MTTGRLARGAVVVAVCLVASALLVAPVGAGDGSAVMSFDDEDVTAAPGETVEVDVLFSSHGDGSGNGVTDIDVTVGHDTDNLSVANVEYGTWFEEEIDGDEVEIHRTNEVDEETGNVTIQKERDPPGDGTTNYAPVATITFEVDEDAELGPTELEFTDSSAGTSGDYRQNAIERTGTIEIEEATGDEPMHGFGAAVALGSLLLAVLVGLRRRR
ncbi:cohesin domain-containing protein [Halostagnicola sp. A-GB9-2]|uniref:cohesin domain-containing protein n=1 Tax=Halostagnicola sp. A-GB9-2 TaxID=3048066 RepID=UPI0024C0BDDB|nr:cohesin domain-containing protein [Halostagnicola sp. A-GB9-2]MDJ1432624.1 cohesin domain-containing protein [Halostagnicola sp. A-GB9-2]